MGLVTDFSNGIYRENPVFRLTLGMCPFLAVTTSVENALGMGAASMFVLFFSNLLVSMFRKVIPSKVRIPCYIVIIASFVTVVDLVMAGFTPDLHKNLGIFIPLIVVNCIILGRAEAFASKNSVGRSFIDGLGMGLGFTFALIITAAIREIIGTGRIWDLVLLGTRYNPVLLAILSPGAFITLGLLIGLFNLLEQKRA